MRLPLLHKLIQSAAFKVFAVATGVGFGLSLAIPLLCLASSQTEQALREQAKVALLQWQQVKESSDSPTLAVALERNLGAPTPANPALPYSPLPSNKEEKAAFGLSANAVAVQVPLTESEHGGLLVPVTLPQRKQTVSFLLDTGASYTMISPALAERLGLRPNRNQEQLTIVTANGKIQVPLMKVPQLEVGGFTLKNIEVLIQPLDERLGFHGLLGMNALNQADWQLKSDQLTLEPRVIRAANNTPLTLSLDPLR